MEDKELVNKMRRGDTDAYKELFIKYYSPLCAYASRFVSDVDAEELVQNLMLYLWEERDRITIENSVRSYLFMSIRNRSFNMIRDRKQQHYVDLSAYDEEHGGSSEFYTADDLEHRIQSLVDELPDSYRETFELSRFRDLTNKQIASDLQVSVKTIEYRITRALKILRKKLKDY